MSVRAQNARKNALQWTSEFKQYRYVLEYKALLISVGTRFLRLAENFNRITSQTSILRISKFKCFNLSSYDLFLSQQLHGRGQREDQAVADQEMNMHSAYLLVCCLWEKWTGKMSCSGLYSSGLEFGLECESRSYPWTKTRSQIQTQTPTQMHGAFSATAEPVVVHVVIMHV